VKFFYSILILSFSWALYAKDIKCNVQGSLSAVPERSADGSWKPNLVDSKVSFDFNQSVTFNDQVDFSLKDIISKAILDETLSPTVCNSEDSFSLSRELINFISSTQPHLSIRYQKDLETISPSVDLDAKKVVVDKSGWTENLTFQASAGLLKSQDILDAGMTRKGFRIYLGEGKMMYSGRILIRTICE
jgi:hypothetical protein